MLIKEQNAIRKSWTPDKIKIGLIYPNTYRVGMTSLGVQLLYFLFNEWENFICERIFKPLNPKTKPYSLENQKKLQDFDVLAISCQFEHDYVEAINLLFRGDVNPDSRLRKDNEPLVIVGGPSPTANPFAVLFLADAFFLGDIEPVAEKIRTALEKDNKSNRLESLTKVQGIMALGYHYDNDGKWLGDKVERVKIQDLSNAFHPIRQIIPEDVKGTKNEPIFGKAFYLETDRGCSERCLFCFIGHCHFPRVGRNIGSLTKIIDQASEVNDFEKVVIYGSAIAQSGALDALLEYIINKGYEVSCSSFRADYITEDLLKILRKGRQKTITLAPETGDEKLRFAINKKIENKTILSSIKLAWETGFRQLKLYMIYGFPCEKDNIRNANFKFLRDMREKSFPKGKISISMNQFITKANTPFQFSKMISIKESKENQSWYKKAFYQLKNIDLSFYNPEWAIVQRILSLRDHQYFPIVKEVGMIGNTIGNWKKSLKAENKDFFEESEWNYQIQDPLPWDNISYVLKKKNLVSSYKRFQEIMNCQE